MARTELNRWKNLEKEKEKHFHSELYTIRIHATFDQKKSHSQFSACLRAELCGVTQLIYGESALEAKYYQPAE